ncbi:hypothetical protein [Streptomyces sp. NPDC002520]
MICVRCGKSIREGERYVAVDRFSPSGPGTTAHVHEERCQPTPQQTYPTRRRGT